ncbi:MAG TPA: type II toxin-antitoxin system HicB family antitoxin [Nitrospiraceae bacterium]|nr:type II toxin-antitoxin system HicB family antitoxin [Nitrospiraceae bacterium]
MKLHVVIEQDEAGYYVAEVPALPGCLSQGKTRDMHRPLRDGKPSRR